VTVRELSASEAAAVTDRRPYSRTGLSALKAKVKIRGLTAIDQRTVAARGLLDWRGDLIEDLGGPGHVSAAQLALVDVATRTRLYLDHLDAFLMEQNSLINKKRRSVFPVVRERQQLADSLARILAQLGVERRAKPPRDLAEYLTTKYRHDGEPARHDEPAGTRPEDNEP